MASLNGFNADEFKDEYTPLPAGRYTAMIVKSETQATKAGNGSYLKLEIDIVDGQYKGRKLFENLNLENPNQQAVNIAKATLANICRAVNILHPKDSSELHLKPISIMVSVEPERDGYPASNRVKRWDAPESAAQTKMDFSKAPAPANAKPWERPVVKAEETPTF
jgi:hypothetical protein